MNDHAYRPIIRSQADLETVWRHLMQPLGFATGSVWMLRLEADGRAVPRLMEIADAELAADPREEPEPFAALLADLDSVEPGGSYAFLRSRPGRDGIRPEDRAWAGFLYAAGRLAGVRLEVVHLATDADVVPLPLDEVGLPRSA
ncbi:MULTISPECIES: hypothetical protein [unclassified Nocardioides]|uniref:hypothetical protein n=1 Tax=unclassified Nocardioides TaxID=2615069 RepID=UPI0000570517|nr:MULTISPECIES: hypothetical protein [unclassified Nocardioides]ABL83219.1 hypothetical protein Noca_3719 [Nocardioides sp. JS614]